MALPVRRVDIRVFYGITRVDHHPVPDIDPHMARARGVISPLEKYQVAGPCLGRGYRRAAPSQPFRRLPAHVPAVAAVVDDPAHKTGAVKPRFR